MAKPLTRPKRTPAKSPKPQEPHPSVTALRAEFASGPIPHPALLEGYERLVPGAAERILAMAEAESAHSQRMEMEILRATESERRRGQVFGLSIGLAALSACVIALLVGAYAAASVIGGATVLGLVSVFITGHILKSK